MRVIATITEPLAVKKILSHLGIRTEPTISLTLSKVMPAALKIDGVMYTAPPGDLSGEAPPWRTTLSQPEVTVQQMRPELLKDFLRFFDGDAFADNPRWASCYCQCFYEDHSQINWKARTADENRAFACERIEKQRMQGYLAYVAGEPVGWCNAAPRRMITALANEPIADADTVGTIMCFLVAPAFRGRGVASALLSAACAGLRAQGLEVAEANPRPNAAGPADNHFGPLAMYLSAGFRVQRTDSDGSVWVRKPLGHRPGE